MLQKRLGWLMYLDAPDHTRLRKSTNRAFVPTEISGIKEDIEQSAKQFLTPLRGKEQLDVLNDFATPFSIKVVADMIGFPEQDHMCVKKWSDDIVAYLVGRFLKRLRLES
jgi:cytochrome P450